MRCEATTEVRSWCGRGCRQVHAGVQLSPKSAEYVHRETNGDNAERCVYESSAPRKEIVSGRLVPNRLLFSSVAERQRVGQGEHLLASACGLRC